MTQAAPFPADFNPAVASFAGRHILVAGADTDLGQEISRDLADAGASLVLQTAKQRNVSALYDEIAANGCEEPLIVEINLAKAEPVHLDQLVQGLGGSLGHLDGLVYLDAPSAPLAPIALVAEEQIASALEQGVMRPFRLVRALLPLLQQSTSPALVFQTLDAGREAKPYWAANGPACAALDNLAATIATEHDAFRVSTINFGKVASALRHRAYPGEARSTLRECDDRLLLDSLRFLLIESDGEHFGLPDATV